MVNRAAHLRGVIPIAFFNAKRITMTPTKVKATITLLLKLKVSFLLQFLQFHSKKRNLKSI